MLHTAMDTLQPLNSPTFDPFASFNKSVVDAEHRISSASCLSSSPKRIYYCQRCLNHGRLAPRKNHKAECTYSKCDCEKCILVERRRVLNTQLHELEELEEQPASEQPPTKPEATVEESQEKIVDVQSKTSSPSSTLSSLMSSAAQSPLSSSSVLLATADSTINDFFVSQQQSLFPSSTSSPTDLRLKGERVPQCQKCSQHGRKVRLKGHKRFCAFKDCTCPKCQVITQRQKLMADQIKIRRRQSKDTWMKLRRQRFSSEVTLSAGGMVMKNPSQSSPLEDQSTFSNNYLSQLNQFYKNIATSNNHLAISSLDDSLYNNQANHTPRMFDNSLLSSSVHPRQQQAHSLQVEHSSLDEMVAEKKREILAQMLSFMNNEPVDFSTSTTTAASPCHSLPSSHQSVVDALLAKISQQRIQKEEISPPPARSYSPTNLLPITPLMLNGLPIARNLITPSMSLPTLTTSPNKQFNFPSASSDVYPISFSCEDETVKNSQVSPPMWSPAEPSFTAQQLMLLQMIKQNGMTTDVEEQKEKMITSTSISSSPMFFSQEQIRQLLSNSSHFSQ